MGVPPQGDTHWRFNRNFCATLKKAVFRQKMQPGGDLERFFAVFFIYSREFHAPGANGAPFLGRFMGKPQKGKAQKGKAQKRWNHQKRGLLIDNESLRIPPSKPRLSVADLANQYLFKENYKMLKKKMTQVAAVAFIAMGSAAIIVGCGDDAVDDGPSPKDGPKIEQPKGGDKNGPGPDAPKPPSGAGGDPAGKPEGLEGKK